jgi:hypothetical protein
LWKQIEIKLMFWRQRDTETSDVPADLLSSSVYWCNMVAENLTEEDRLEDLGIDGILKKRDTRARTEFAWLKRWLSSVFCEHSNELSASVECGRFY